MLTKYRSKGVIKPFENVIISVACSEIFSGRGPQIPFENLHTLMAILLLFKQFSGKFCLNFSPNPEFFSKYDAFCSYIFDYACLRSKVFCYRRGWKLWKNIIHQKHFYKIFTIVLLTFSGPDLSEGGANKMCWTMEGGKMSL